jgi:hypothetical protein
MKRFLKKTSSAESPRAIIAAAISSSSWPDRSTSSPDPCSGSFFPVTPNNLVFAHPEKPTGDPIDGVELVSQQKIANNLLEDVLDLLNGDPSGDERQQASLAGLDGPREPIVLSGPRSAD